MCRFTLLLIFFQVLSQDIYGLSKIKESLDSFCFLMTEIWTLCYVYIGLFSIPSFNVRSDYNNCTIYNLGL